MKTEVLNVTGMTCGACVASVKHALGALAGVANVAVSLPRNEVEVQFDDMRVGVPAMRDALQAAGYDVAAAPTKGTGHGGRCCS